MGHKLAEPLELKSNHGRGSGDGAGTGAGARGERRWSATSKESISARSMLIHLLFLSPSLMSAVSSSLAAATRRLLSSGRRSSHGECFSDVLHEYTVKTKKVSELVLRSMSKLLELDEDYLSNQFGDKAEVFARFNYYPCCSRPDLVFGIKPHSDGSAFTIVLPDKDVEGLQVLKDGVWVKVPTIPHALIINMGDQMEIMTNGIFKSPVHRVVTNPEKDRISIAMFHAIEAEKELKPADGLVGEGRPKLYKTMTTKEYLGFFFQHFVQGRRAIEEWAKT